MDDRIHPPTPATFFQYPPTTTSTNTAVAAFHSSPSPHHSSIGSPVSSNRDRYLAELLAERQKLVPFTQVLPFCHRLLNQEILRASGMLPSHGFVDPDRMDHGSPLRLPGHPSNVGPMDVEGWPGMQTEVLHPSFIQESGYFHRMGAAHGSTTGWNGVSGVNGSLVVKKVVRLDVPVDKYPNFNFVGRLLGPRGNSLKRVEATTHCRVYIRGRGSVKDSVKEEKLRDKPGYEHLNEPLHILVEAEFPAEVIDARLNQAVAILEDLLKPVDESMDYYKKQQLRELAILNGTLRDESPSPHMSPSTSPFNSTGMKRAKTGR